MKNIKLQIEKMTCINCSNAITKVAKKLNGVKDAKVDFLKGVGFFEVEDDYDIDELIAKIEKLGFKVNKEKLSNNTLIKVIIGAILSVGLFFSSHVYENYLSSLILATFGVIIVGSSIYKKAFFLAKQANYGMDFLVSFASLLCFFYSVFSYKNHHLYFFESVFIVFFVMIGKHLEQKAKDKIKSCFDDIYEEKEVKLQKNNNIITIPPNQANIGDVLLYAKGEKISHDGIALCPAIIDTSMIDGEYLPKTLKTGDEVLSGSLVLESSLSIKVQKEYQSSFYEEIKKAMQKAHLTKLKIASLADIVSRYFVLLVGCFGLAVFLYYAYFYDINAAIKYTANVFLISCPCALGLAVPLVLSIAINTAFRHNIILKNAMVLEDFKNATFFIFDKTGTLCKSELSIKKCTIDDKTLSMVKAIEAKSSHPIAKAILNYKNATVKIANIKDEVKLCDGGVKCNEIMIGSSEFVGINDDEFDIYVKDKTHILGGIKFENTLKNDSKKTIDYLLKQGKKIAIISGDKKENVKNIALQLNIKKYFYKVSPNNKLRLLNMFKKYGKTAYIGDGLNDLPTLAGADFAISFDNASALAQNKSDVILLQDGIQGVATLYKISAYALSKIKQNLFLSFCYNIFMIPLAAGFFEGFGLSMKPWYCVVFMFGSSMAVVLNSILMLYKKY